MRAEWIFLVFYIIIITVVFTYVFGRIYKKNIKVLDMYDGAIKIRPNRRSFLVSLTTFCLAISLPLHLALWISPIDKEVFYISLLFVPMMPLITFFPAYPYYTLLVHDGKLNGPTLWGREWTRAEINISEIDKEKVLQQNLGRALGITVFTSRNGVKTLSLGLNDSQIREIFEHSTKDN